MESLNIKILVATHKKYWMPEDKVFLPVQLGAAYANEDLGYQRDDEGKNISLKRPHYSELTALYWAWKNLNVDYLGLCQYRRYFSCRDFKSEQQGSQRDTLHRADFESILQTYEIILPTPTDFGDTTVRQQYADCHYVEDLNLVREIIVHKCPKYVAAFDKVMGGHRIHTCNMFVTKKSIADEYCAWLFPILFELEQQVDFSNYDEYQQRVCGYMAERLFNVWLFEKNLKVYSTSIVLLGQSYWDDKKLSGKLKAYVKKIFHKSF